MPNTILDQINQDQRNLLVKEKKKIGFEAGAYIASKLSKTKKIDFKENSLVLIAEIKRSSPSSGQIREYFEPTEILDEFGDVPSAISVLTNQKFFQGSNLDLIKVKQSTDKPVLRKDFIIDKYQLLESRIIGADIVLLIVMSLKDQLKEFVSAAIALGLNILIETHSEEEINLTLQTIKDLEFQENQIIIGINSRDLQTFEIDLDRILILSKLIPEEIPVIAESGILSVNDLEKIREYDFQGCLIGEGLAKNPELINWFKT